MRSGASSSTTSFAEAETRNIVRYFVVGGVCALVDLALFLAFAQGLGLPYLRVSAGSFVVATLLNYFLSVRFVFVSGLRFQKRWEMALVFAVSAVGLGLNQLILALCVEQVGLNLFFSKVTATGCVFFWNYFARRVLVFGGTHA
ncbi:MAG TPA: GtrA family protein [Usitatibacter sp.]|nr:GtrA family protein [Usitatibacter sp.]